MAVNIHFDRLVARPGTALVAGLAVLGGLIGPLNAPLTAAAAGSVTLSAISTGFPSPIGIDYYQPTDRVIMSVNYSSGLPYNFVLVAADGTQSQFSNVSGLTDEVYVVAIRPSSCQGGFTPGDVFVGTGTPGVIAKLTNGGATRIEPWVSLAGESGLLRGGVFQDKNCVAGGDLIATTTAGDVWRITSAGVATELATGVGDWLEGPTTVPNDPRYGPWAGQILAASESCGCVRSIDPTTGVHSTWGLGQANMTGTGVASAEGIHVVPPNENFYGVDYGSGTLQGASYTQFSGMVGDIVVATEFPGRLVDVAWNATAGTFTSTDLLTVNASQWEGTTFAPAGIPPIPPAPPPVPGPPQGVAVRPGNGFAIVSWQPPASAGAAPVTGYLVTATATYTDRRPSPYTPSVSYPVDSTTLSLGIRGLLADCHQIYVVSVAAKNAAGFGPPATSAAFRPSGIVLRGSPPPYVVILLDGFGSAQPGFTMNPYLPTTDNRPSYCPEAWTGPTVQSEANFSRTPSGPWSFFHKWNIGEIDILGSGTGNDESAPRAVPNNPDFLGVGTYTHSYMLDAIAGQGAIILPFSYTGFILTNPATGDPTFSYRAYSICDSSPGCGPTIPEDSALLARQVNAVAALWPSSRIVVMGHSQGGLIAFGWWLGPRHPSSFAAAFSLDSPINGVCTQAFGSPCAGPPTYPRYAWRTILDPLFLALDSDRGESFRFIGTYGDSPLEGYQSGAKTLEHQLLFNYRQYSPSQIESLCANPMNEAGCPAPAPPNHISECPVRLASSPDWQNKAAHFVEKFCPGDVAYFNATLGLSY